MSFDLTKLDSMSREQLMAIADQSNVRVHHKAGAEKIKEAIINQVMQPPKEELKHAAEKPKAPVFHHTPQDVEELVSKIKERVPQFRTSYSEEDNTWLFQWVSESGRVMREESGNLSIPPRVIKIRAETVSRGPLLLRSMNKHFDDMPTAQAGKNSYTNTVL